MINCLGLRMAFRQSPNLVEALTFYDGLDCAVNFAASYVDYRREGSVPPLLRDLEPFMRLLVSLSVWPPLDGRAPATDQGRLASAAGAVGITRDGQANFAELPDQTETAIEVLRAQAKPEAPPRVDDPVLDAAALTRHVFQRMLPRPPDVEGLPAKLDKVIAGRGDAGATLRTRYQAYARVSKDGVGPGPLVAAKVMTKFEWDELEARLLSRLPSIVPALSAFTL